MPADASNREEMIHTLAQQKRLPTSYETDDRTTVIRGRAGCHLYEYSDSELGLMVLSDAKDARPRRWGGNPQEVPCCWDDPTAKRRG